MNETIAIIKAKFNPEITNNLCEGAQKTLEKLGVEQVEIIEVPGAFELPYGCLHAIKQFNPVGLIVLGCVIRGETPHFDYICQATSIGLTNLSINKKIPLGFGLLTVENLQQAKDRAVEVKKFTVSGLLDKHQQESNKGIDAAMAVWELLKL